MAIHMSVGFYSDFESSFTTNNKIKLSQIFEFTPVFFQKCQNCYLSVTTYHRLRMELMLCSVSTTTMRIIVRDIYILVCGKMT
jgi:hypothetical protein